jgi:hypothetical protein
MKKATAVSKEAAHLKGLVKRFAIYPPNHAQVGSMPVELS